MEYAYAHTHDDAALAVVVETTEHAHESWLDTLLHVVEHSVLDTLYLIPFLFVTYLAMEWLEHKTGVRTQSAIRRAGAAGPAIGAVLGAVPQCGFSAAAATLYAGRVVTLGTLFAVFLSTSDEMLPIFLAEQVPLPVILKILGAKVAIGMVMGFAVDAAVRFARHGRPADGLRIHELCERDGCACNHECATCEANPELVYGHHDDSDHHDECGADVCGHDHAACNDRGIHGTEGREGSDALSAASCHEFSCGESHCKGHDHDHSHDHEHGLGSIAKSALVHTAQVTVFILVITLVLNAVLEVVGEDALAHFLAVNPALSILASALVGLVPNCAASVVIAQLYVEGVLGAGAMLAGLLVSAGVGLLVLVRANRPAKQNLVIIAALLAMGALCGMVVHLLGIAF
ncbi:MAG: arsenic efflux protein [Eggerthellaceae bacterium]|nr:arsenic efflux protein [Eggerthellaceae bacterium]